MVWILLCRFESRLLPAENKPLEMSVLKRVKELLAEVDAKTAAKHITIVDCAVRTGSFYRQEKKNNKQPQKSDANLIPTQVARILGVNSEMQRMMGVSSGLELLTLPHGHQLRLDLLERYRQFFPPLLCMHHTLSPWLMQISIDSALQLLSCPLSLVFSPPFLSSPSQPLLLLLSFRLSSGCLNVMINAFIVTYKYKTW